MQVLNLLSIAIALSNLWTDGDLTDALQNQDILNELSAQLTQGTHADGSSVYLTQGTVNDQGQEVKGQANVDKGLYWYISEILTPFLFLSCAQIYFIKNQ